MSQEYAKTVKGKLSFKGDSKKDKSVKRKRDVPSGGSAPSSSAAPEEPVDYMKEYTGTGRITSSGITVHGHFTEFMTQLAPGDAIIITHPTTLQEETKVVRMVLSNLSIGISSSFSTDLISTTPFRYMKAPKDVSGEQEQQDKALRKKHKVEEDAFGTYASQGGEKFVYRVKKEGGFGGYKVVTESTDKALSREDLLKMRSKKKSDRFCY